MICASISRPSPTRRCNSYKTLGFGVFIELGVRRTLGLRPLGLWPRARRSRPGSTCRRPTSPLSATRGPPGQGDRGEGVSCRTGGVDQHLRRTRAAEGEARAESRGPAGHGALRARRRNLGEHILPLFRRTKAAGVAVRRMLIELQPVRGERLHGNLCWCIPIPLRPSWPRRSIWPGYPWKANRLFEPADWPWRPIPGYGLLPDGPQELNRPLRCCRVERCRSPLIFACATTRSDDFCLSLPAKTRLKHLFGRRAAGARPELVRCPSEMLTRPTLT